MLIKGFIKTSYVDYPGKISSVIFLAGCNFRCSYCYNKELVLNPNALDTISKEYVFDYLNKRKHMIQGICVSGGEPTVNANLPEFISELKKFDLPVKLDTNGTNPQMLLSLISEGLVDYVALDIKNPLNTEYIALANPIMDKTVSNIKDTLNILDNSGISFEIRTTIIKRIHTPDVLETMVQNVMEALSADTLNVPWFLQPFRPGNCMDSQFDTFEETDEDYLNELAETVINKASLVKVR